MTDTTLRVAVVVGRDAAAAEELVRSLPPQSELALIFAMAEPRQLSKLLRGATSLPVIDVYKSMPIEGEHIYVLPRDRETSIHKRWLAIDAPNGNANRDRLLRSLADSLGPDCAAVILGGRGSDGVLGAKRVKEVGGLTICQLTSEAESSELPRTASASGIIDLALPAAEIGPRLLSLASSGAELAPRDPAATDPLTDVLAMIRTRTGHDLRAYKASVLRHRIARRMQISQVASLEDYVRFLQAHPTELAQLFHDCLLTVTDFFHGPDAFAALAEKVVPKLFKGRASEQVRVWVAGCATGEEAYSIAMLLCEHVARYRNPPTVHVFASDIDDEALRDARVGIYPEAIAADVSETRLRRFFSHEADRYRVGNELREIVAFSSHDVLRDAPFSRIDLISCRGTLPYLNDDEQEHLLATFHSALRPDGHLFLGLDEDAHLPYFEPLDLKHHIFGRRHMAGYPKPRRLEPAPVTATAGAESVGDLHRRIVDHYAPASVLINDDLDVLHASAGAERYFRAAVNDEPPNVLRLVHPALSGPLARAIYAARDRSLTSASRPVWFEDGRQLRAVEVRARAIDLPDSERPMILVTVDEHEDDEDVERAAGAHDELRAMNEELQVATAELEHGKAELHSINRTLTDLNHQIATKVDDVRRANETLQHWMVGTDLGVLLLDRELRVVRFTSRISAVLGLSAADVGQQTLTQRVHPWSDELAGAVAEAVAGATPVERELERDGRRYAARIAPLRSTTGALEGVALTFVDVTELRRGEATLDTAARRLHHALHDDSVIAIGQDRALAIEWIYVGGHPRVVDLSLFTEPALYMAIARQVIASGLATSAELAVALDGGTRRYQFQIEPTLDRSQVIGVTAIGFDASFDA